MGGIGVFDPPGDDTPERLQERERYDEARRERRRRGEVDMGDEPRWKRRRRFHEVYLLGLRSSAAAEDRWVAHSPSKRFHFLN